MRMSRFDGGANGPHGVKVVAVDLFMRLVLSTINARIVSENHHN
jgi:hypothetical protein